MANAKTYNIQVEQLKTALDQLESSSEIDEALNLINKIKKRIEKLETDFESAESENLDEPLLKSIKIEENEFELLKKRFEEKENEWKIKKDRMDCMNGNLNGAESRKVQKDIVLDQHKQIDNQGVIIDSIAENIKGANTNLVNINAELNDQGEQIDRIQQKTNEAERVVVQTGKVINGMQQRAKCIQILTCLGVFVFGVFDAAWLVFLLFKRYG